MTRLTAMILGAGLLVPAPSLMGQTIAERTAGIGDGKVLMSYAARPGVCGNGRDISLGFERRRRSSKDDRVAECEPGPIRVVVRLRDGVVVDVDAYVGGSWVTADSRTLDLGTVPAPEAAGYLVELGRRSAAAGKDALFAAWLADGVMLWPRYLELARDRSLSAETRRMAVFLVGDAASDAVTAELEEIVDDGSDDREVREMAIFALSRRPADEAVPALISIVERNRDPDLVRLAIFWLGETGDPRALEFFEELLVGQ